tara:strand:- start:1366 stop:1728 length:363 start_codon:yes stop_codon:yes gene_type:complete
LGRYFDNAQVGMDAEKYLTMCATFGDTPDPEKMPPEYSSFPSYVHVAMEIFNALPDLFSGGMSPIYTGKAISSLPVLYDLYMVDNHMKMKTFNVIRFLDSRARKQAVKEAEKANKKASRK